MSQLSAALFQAGVLAPPYEDIPEELLRELLSLVDLVPTNVLRDPLSISMEAGAFHVYDSLGFVCSTRKPEVVIILLMLQARPMLGGVRSVMRGKIDAQPSDAAKSHLSEFQERARQLVANLGAKGLVQGEPGYGTPEDGSRLQVKDGTPVRTIGQQSDSGTNFDPT